MPTTTPAPAAPAAPVAYTERIRGEQIRTLYRTAPVALSAALIGALVLCGVLLYIDAQTPQAVALWMALVAADCAVRQGLCLLFRRRQPPLADWRSWAQRFTVATLFGGLVWGGGAVWLMTGDNTQQLVIMLFISATASGAVPAFGSWLPATYAYTVPALLPFVLWSATHGDPFHNALALMGVVFTTVFLLLAHRFNANLIESLRLRFENLDLVDDLQRQKEIAEQANIAKSRFLAAASHDLRQPVHALGMFVGALRGRSMDDEARRLVQHLDARSKRSTACSTRCSTSRGSTRASCSRSSNRSRSSRCSTACAQTTPPKRRAKACACVRTAAGPPWSATRCCWSASCATSSPTPCATPTAAASSSAAGAASCSASRSGTPGAALRSEQQARVFEEFYQIGNPERDRARGLGLGLAIVKRLTHAAGLPADAALGARKGLGVQAGSAAVAQPAGGRSGFRRSRCRCRHRRA